MDYSLTRVFRFIRLLFYISSAFRVLEPMILRIYNYRDCEYLVGVDATLKIALR